MDVFPGAALLFGILLLEILLMRRKGLEVPWSAIAADLSSGHIPMWILRGVEVAGFAWISSRTPVTLLRGIPPVVEFLAVFALWDLSFYWLHRLHHALPILWRVHAVHHQGEAYGLSLGIRNAWLSSLTSLPFFVPLAAMGVSATTFVTVGSIHYLVQFWNHSALAGSYGPLERVMVTPTHHRVHHGTAEVYRDTNFGGTLVIWDKFFGSFQTRREDHPLQYGLDGHTPVANPLVANLAPLLGRTASPAPRGRRDERDELHAGLSGLLLFTLLLHYVRESPGWSAPASWIWAGVVTLATIVLGARTDGAAWARPAWTWAGPSVCLAGSLALGSWWIALVAGALVAVDRLLHAARA